ncbi:MAG: Uma2 family endonuclease, partial [Bacteroidetes bacterium]
DFHLFCSKIEEFWNFFEFSEGQIYNRHTATAIPDHIVDLVLQTEIENFLNIYQLSMSNAQQQITISNLNKIVWSCVTNKNFRVYSQGVSVPILAKNAHRVPDLLITNKNKEERNAQDQIENPLLIIEVLSPSTAHVDLNEKLTEYQSIPNLQEYIIIYQDQPKALQYSKNENNFWQKTTYEGLEESIIVDFLTLVLPLENVYKRVKFD